ncbi:uncharacterized protein [Dysidea avara]|uniref:uncharacterized protein isoform X2 n=1 Tax=Dysidea avara TaxID=196820 RepID=UPI003331ED25
MAREDESRRMKAGIILQSSVDFVLGMIRMTLLLWMLFSVLVEVNTQEGCDNAGIDLVFVLDGSGSVRSDRFQMIREFTTKIANSLTIGSQDSLVGVIVFSSSASIHFILLQHTNATTLEQALNSIPYPGGVTDTAEALQLLLSSAQNGRMGIRDGHPHIAIIVTDGLSSNRAATLADANALHAANIYQVYAAGLGNANLDELNAIASDPSLVFFTNEFNADSVAELTSNFTQMICQEQTCQLLVAPDNGMINCSLGDDGQASLGDTCTFTCNSGYELSGNTSRSCQINGNWSGTESTCTQVDSENNIDDCDPNPCINNGTCTDGVDSFTCNCVNGFTGVNCTTNIDDCNPNPCMNNGICTDGVNYYTCNCVEGFTGENCTSNIDDCDPNPCMNNELTVTRSFTSVTILEGQSVTLSCSPSIMELAMTWIHNGTNIVVDDITFSASNQNLIIRNALTTHSGVYTCIATADEISAKENISVNILPACENDFSEGLFWPNSRQDLLVTQSCSLLHLSFRSGVNIGRQCESDGSWSPVDLRNCTMFIGSQPVVIVYFTVSFNNTDAMTSVNIVDKVLEVLQDYFGMNHLDIGNPVNRTWSYNLNNGVMFMSFSISFNLQTMPLSSRNILTDVQDSLRTNENNIFPTGYSLTNQGFQVLLFQTSLSCSCSVNINNDDRNFTVCSGPSVAPCLCDSHSCMCNSPTFAGDGNVCGLDSDSDGFPDVDLGCDEPTCDQDKCLDVFSIDSDGTQSDVFCKEMDDLGCQLEQDDIWNITWPATVVAETAIQKCPGGSEVEGLASRRCVSDDQWASPDVSQCQTIEQIRLLMRAVELSNLVNNTITSENRDLTVMFMPEILVEIATELDEITNPSESQPLLPNDISSSAITLDIIIAVTETVIGDIGQQMSMQIVENVVDILDNLLDERNDISFQDMIDEEGNTISPSELLQMTTERIGIIYSTTLNTSGNESVQASLVGNNIVIEVQIPTEEYLKNVESVNFPSVLNTIGNNMFDKMTPMIQIPNSILLNQITVQGRRIAVVNAVSRNVHLSTDPGTRIESLILSSQISTERVNLGDDSVTLSFDIQLAENQSYSNIRCSFFDFSGNSNQRGQFSEDGIQQIGSNRSFVQCASSHLTSFTVLVDTTGGSAQSEALSIVSYVGCGISIVCLTFTIIVLIVLRKKMFSKVPDFVHLNLSIALLLGLIVFVSGIETATRYRASCLIVAILLHYFFTAAFSWMLCEGVMLFIWFNFVWYEGVFKTRKFFMLLGWGFPVPIVIVSAAVSHEHYGSDDMCWITEERGAIWAFIAPMLLIILINMFFLIVSLYQIYGSKKYSLQMVSASKFQIGKILVKAAVLLLPLLGLTWLFGLLAVNEDTVVFAWLFTILNSLQGFFIALFYVIRNEQFLKFVKEHGKLSLFSESNKTNTTKTSNGNSSLNDKNNMMMLNSKDQYANNKNTIRSQSAIDDVICNECVSSPTKDISGEAQIVTVKQDTDDEDHNNSEIMVCIINNQVTSF